MRPDSIRKFDMFFLASIALAVASGLLNYETQVSSVTEVWRDAGLQDYAGSFVIGILGISFLVNVLLWYLASRMRQGWVKWVLIVFIVYTSLTTVSALSMGFGNVSITALITLLLKVIAVYFLFRSDAKEWFASKGE